MNKAAIPQPPPKGGDITVWPLVIEDIKARVEMGKRKYGTELKTNNGRDALWDAYQEMIDALFYLRQEIEDRNRKSSISLEEIAQRLYRGTLSPGWTIGSLIEASIKNGDIIIDGGYLRMADKTHDETEQTP